MKDITMKVSKPVATGWDIENLDSARIGRGTWAMWVLASAAGLAVGEAAFGVFSETMGHGGWLGPEGGFGDMVAHTLGLLISGALLGILQWLVLRPYAGRAGWLVVGNGVGLAAGFLLGWVLGGFPFDFLVGALLLGLGGGIAQWLALRRHIGGTARAIPASTLGFGLGGVAAILVILPLGDALSTALGGGVLSFAMIVGIIGAIAGAVGGIVTGGVLVRLLNRPSWR